MNTYSVYRLNELDGESIGVVQAIGIEEATNKAKFTYGTDVYVVRQYSTSTTSFDPIWILLALLLVAVLTKKRS